MLMELTLYFFVLYLLISITSLNVTILYVFFEYHPKAKLSVIAINEVGDYKGLLDMLCAMLITDTCIAREHTAKF